MVSLSAARYSPRLSISRRTLPAMRSTAHAAAMAVVVNRIMVASLVGRCDGDQRPRFTVEALGGSQVDDL